MFYQDDLEEMGIETEINVVYNGYQLRDVNLDGVLNILDIVAIVNIILNS